MRSIGAGQIIAMLFAVFISTILISGCAASKETQKPPGAGKSAHGEGFEWFYESFDEKKTAAYDAFRISAERPFDSEPVPIRDKSGTVTEIAVSDLAAAYQGFLYDHPEVFWLSGSYNYRVSGDSGGEEMADAVSVIPIPDSEQDLRAAKKDFESAAEHYLLKAADAEGDREKAKILYESLAGEIEYEEEALYDSALLNEHTAYGAVCKKKAVCDGMALAYKYLLDRCGIRCILIPGTSEGAPHVWNTVFWDERWHESDLTWDTVSEAKEGGQYFDLTSEEMNKDHEREKEGIAIRIPLAD